MAYSTYEVAEMLEVNPETVRRWIRDGKLQATRDSKKKGFYIVKQDLKVFIYEHPKYANRGFPVSSEEISYYHWVFENYETAMVLQRNLEVMQKAVSRWLKKHKSKES